MLLFQSNHNSLKQDIIIYTQTCILKKHIKDIILKKY